MALEQTERYNGKAENEGRSRTDYIKNKRIDSEMSIKHIMDMKAEITKVVFKVDEAKNLQGTDIDTDLPDEEE